MREKIVLKKLGIGSLSLIISIFAMIFQFSAIGDKYIGEYILDALRISFPYTIVSISLAILSIFIGYKYKDDLYAKQGLKLGIIFLVICAVLTITSAIF